MKRAPKLKTYGAGAVFLAGGWYTIRELRDAIRRIQMFDAINAKSARPIPGAGGDKVILALAIGVLVFAASQFDREALCRSVLSLTSFVTGLCTS